MTVTDNELDEFISFQINSIEIQLERASKLLALIHASTQTLKEYQKRKLDDN